VKSVRIPVSPGGESVVIVVGPAVARGARSHECSMGSRDRVASRPMKLKIRTGFFGASTAMVEIPLNRSYPNL